MEERAGFLFLVEILRERRLSREDLEGDIWRASSEIGQVSEEMRGTILSQLYVPPCDT